jgi:hypothetical protein
MPWWVWLILGIFVVGYGLFILAVLLIKKMFFF